MIRVENLTKEFKNYTRGKGLKGTVKSLFHRDYTLTKAVDQVSFDIDEGEIIGYIGANGAGKSTTIKMMTGILVPSSGACIVNGKVPYDNRIDNAKNIGVVFGQKTQLWWDLPLGETYSILKEIYEVSDEDYQERLNYFKEVLEIDQFMDKTVRTLSLGQRMRADLAAAMLHNPKVLYLDEPTIGLDVVVKERIRTAIKDMNQKYKTTIILTTHDMSDIEELCNRIIIIDKGKIIYDGEIEKIKKEYGYTRTVTIEIRESIGDEEVLANLNQVFNLSEENLNASKEENVIKITFNREKISVSEIMGYMLKKVNVIDFSISETDIEEIVKKLYIEA
ncbi:ABC transporter ATP-binding protein [Vallitalea okinawensis]|nr:ATP-binding cassette domain-containing protein [Vallitalea okinawensis]